METNRYSIKNEQLKEAGNYRFLRDLPGKDPINLSSNDYLGLGTDKDIVDDFLRSHKDQLSFGSCSSRLLTGNANEHGLLEKTLSGAFNKEACLLFNSGYHANIGILPALTGKNDLIVADKLVHSSIIDGMQLSNAKCIRHKHCDTNHLKQILEREKDKYEHIFIITESIFSMDGDEGNLNELVKIKNEYNAFLYVDEAHSFGVRGKNGLGCVEELNLIKDIDFLVGTFGKAIASTGAFVVCSSTFKDYLVNHSRSLIYTTALPQANLAWTNHIINLLPSLSDRRKNLQKISKLLGNKLNLSAQSHIIPLIVGDNHKAIALSDYLLKKGFYCLPIRTPTVPEGTARLRFSLGANIKEQEINELTSILLDYESKLDK